MIKPTRGYVLIEPDKGEQKTATGLIVPENAQEKPQKGIVVAVGECLVSEKSGTPPPSPAKPNDKVYFKRWGGDEIKEDGKEYIIVKFEEVLAVIE